ncbi:MAG: hypothetical protein JXK07_13515 [Spirochaetes bacterium]|nr:hypothetical protein [Spirochaetota bacterium]
MGRLRTDVFTFYFKGTDLVKEYPCSLCTRVMTVLSGIDIVDMLRVTSRFRSGMVL